MRASRQKLVENLRLTSIVALAVYAATLLWLISATSLRAPIGSPVPDDVVFVWSSNPDLNLDIETLPISVPTYLGIVDSVDALDSPAIVATDRVSIGEPGRLETVTRARHTPGLFEIVRAKPESGRRFRPEDATEGARPVAIVSHDLAEDLSNDTPQVIGSTLPMDGRLYEIVGVMPAGFSFPSADNNIPWLDGSVEIWTPFIILDQDRSAYGNISYVVLANLRGTEVETNAQLDALYRRLEATSPDAYRNWSASVRPLRAQVLGRLADVMRLLLIGAIGLVLIALVSFTFVIIARSVSQKRENAVRSALGAKPKDLVLQQISQLAPLSLGSAALGFTLALVTAKPAGRLLDPTGRNPLAVTDGIGQMVLTALPMALLFALVTILPCLLYTSDAADE